MAFDIKGALSAGYSHAEIAEYLGQQNDFDVAGARESGYSDQDILNYLQPPPKERTWTEAAKDTGAQLAEGVNSILGAPADLVAPNSDAAKFFRGNADYWRDQQSDALKQRMATASEAIDAAGEEGVFAQVIEASKQYWNDPALAARFVTTNLPSMIPGIAAAKVAQVAATAAKMANAAGVATTAAGATNAILNAGGARGDAFEDIKQTLMKEQGLSEADAEAQALKDSRFSAAVGGVTGFISGKTGLEAALVGKGVRKGVASAATEMLGEQLEEVSPRLATNYQAGQYDGRSLGQGVGRTMVETAIGAGPGSVVAGLASPRRNPDATAAQAEADLANASDVSTMVDAASRLAGAEDLNAAVAEFQQATDVFTGEAPTPAPTLDERLDVVKERLSSGELISSLRAIDPGLPQQFLSDFQVARNPNSDTLQRGQALDRIDALLMRTDPETVPANDADLAGWARSVPFDSLVDRLLNSDQAEFQRILKGAQFDDSRLTATLDTVAEKLAAMGDEQVFSLGSYAAQEELARRDALAQAAPDYYGMALQQLEQQKTGQMDQIATQARGQQVDQANAMTQAAGVNAGMPTAMGAAFANARPDTQSIRNQAVTDQRTQAGETRPANIARAQQLADNEAGQFSRSRAKTIQGRRADAITDYELQELIDNPSIPSVSRRSAAVELAARREGQPAQQPQPAPPVQAVAPTGNAPAIGLTPAHLMPTPELQRYAKSKGNVGAIARAELERRATQPVQESAPVQDAPQAERAAPEPTGNADLDAARTALFADGQDVSGIEIAADSGDDISTTATKASAQERTFVKTLAKIFKKRVVLLSGLKEGGFVLKSRPDAIYIGVDAVENHLAVFGHELTHKIKQEYPELYAALATIVKANFTDMAAFRDYYGNTGMTDEALLDEAVGDLIGNRMTEETFWTNVFAKLHEMEGKKAPGIIKRFVESLLSVLRRFKVLASGRQLFKTDEWVKDLDAVKAAAENALAQYLYNVRNGVAPSQVGENDAEIVFATPKRKDFTNQTLPTRWPTSKKLDPAPSVSDDMITDLETLKKDPLQYGKAVKAIIEEPGMHSPDIVNGTIDEQAEHVVERMKSNLLWLHDQIPDSIRERSKLWYDGARKIAEAWAARYEISESQAAGALAVLSPQKDWFMNVTMAERVLDIMHDQMDHKFDGRMDSAAFGFLTKESVKEDPDSQKNLKAYEAARGKTLREVAKHHDLRQMSVWIRAYDEAYHDAKHAIVTPEGGFVEDKTTVKGEPTLRAWGDFITPGKAASIYLDGRPENINKMLGAEHKVRNFYNNIYAPKDARFTTIDTHAVAADMLRALAGADKPVADNFGKTGGTNLTGLSGTYALHYEAYRRAAEARGVLPREMQSITWEAVRGLFTEGFKGKKDNVKAIDAIWSQVDAGELSIDEARNQIIERAGGIETPDWWNEGNAEYRQVLRDKTYVQNRNAFGGAKVTFEVAPDPRNKALKERWNALPQETKNEISHKVAWKIAAKALASFGDENMKGELHQQLGGWLADTNPSLSIWFNKRAAATKINEFARIMGYALDQMGMMRTSPRPFKTTGGLPAKKFGAIIVELSDGMTDSQIHELYTELRTITGKRNKPYISGHTTADGLMVILNNSEWSGISDEDLTQRVGDRLFGRHKVHLDHLFADFPEKGKDNYGLRTKSQENSGSGAEPSLRARADQLRAESRVLLEQLVGDVKRSTRRSDDAGRLGAGSGLGSVDQGEKRGAVSATGIHFSKQQRKALNSSFFGTGLKGAELERVQTTRDERLKHRIYFYVNTGKGIKPEAGVGIHAHKFDLTNVYDATNDPLDLILGRNAEEVEQAVLDAGFDGYMTQGSGVAILLGPRVIDVEYLGDDVPQDVPLAGKAEKSDFGKLQEKVMANRSLPGGEMPGADWKRLMPKLMPEIDVSHLDDGEKYFKNQLVQRPVQVKKSTLRKNFTAKDIPSDLEIRIPVEVEETGEVVYLERNGREALQEAEAEATRWKRLFDCLGRAA